MDFVDVCRKFIAIDSSPSTGNKALVQFIGEYSQSLGLHPQIFSETQNGIEQANIVIRPTASRSPLEFLLQSHLDTSEPGPFGMWKKNGHNPFEAHIIDGKIYGLGAASSKLDFLCKLQAIRDMGKQFQLPPVLLGTFGEESGMVGALKVIRKNLFKARMGIIGEPSGLRLIHAGKGLAVVEFKIPFSEAEANYRKTHNMEESTSSQSRVFNGKPAHSSAPQLGESAIKKMFESLLQMPEGIVIMEIDGGISFNTVPANGFLEIDAVSGVQDTMTKKLCVLYKAIRDLEQKFLEYQDPQFDPPYPTLNIGLIRTFESHVVISGCCRMPPNVSNEIYETWMSKLKQTCDQIKTQFLISDYKKPYSTKENSVLINVCRDELRKMDLPDQPTTQSSTNEASLWSRIGIECVSFGPGVREGNINTPNEHVAIRELEMSIDFYKRIMTRFCL